MASIDPQLAAVMSAGTGILGGVAMWLHQRRTGKLTLTEHHLRYIQEQQQDISDLRADLADLWDWAVRSVGKASAGGVTLDPLPSRPPKSAHTAEPTPG